MQTRYLGQNTITPMAPPYAHSTFNINIAEAWYEAGFMMTAYNCCNEADFSGPMVTGNGVGMHKQDFLYGGNGIIMEGSGMGLDGKFIQVTNPSVMKWNPHYAGVSNPDDAIFEYVAAPQGAFSDLQVGRSVAVDPNIIPALHRVEIFGPRYLGLRRADDTGGGINGHHFDNYAGAGKACMQAWETAGSNIAAAKVKYLGL